MANTSINITFTITNGSSNVADGSYPLDTPLHIELTPSKYYGITSTTVPKLTYIYDSSGNAAWSESFTQSTENEDVWVLDTSLKYYYAKNTAMHCVVKYSFDEKYCEIVNNLTHCTTDKAAGMYLRSESNTITIKADDGYEFQTAPKISYYAYDKTSLPWKRFYYDFEFTMVSATEYTYTFKADSLNKVYTVSAVAVAKTDVTDKYGLIAVYKPTKDILTQLSKVRFAVPKVTPYKYESTVVVETVSDEYVDTGKYIISLRKMYFPVPSTETEKIMLGPYTTDIDCPIVGTDTVTLDMGTVQITGKNKNTLDYKNTEMQIYLPFIGLTDIDTADFMDKDVGLKYEVNVITGECLAIITADGEVMKTESGNASFQVPYILNFHETVNNDLKPNSNYLLETKPFIYVKSYNPAAPDTSMPYNDTKFYAQFSTLSGYTQAQEIDFEVVHDYITKTEIDEIISLIENGVFL